MRFDPIRAGPYHCDMFDLLITNGTVVDGTGADRRIADIAITDGRIVAVGTDLGDAHEVIDAEGLLAPIVAHAGDGNFHVLFIIDPEDSDEMARAERVNARMVERAIAAGGSASPEGAPMVRAGQDVRHPTFGEGVVLDVAGTGDNAEVTVNFADVGQKTLVLGWAKLEVV